MVQLLRKPKKIPNKRSSSGWWHAQWQAFSTIRHPRLVSFSSVRTRSTRGRLLLTNYTLLRNDSSWNSVLLSINIYRLLGHLRGSVTVGASLPPEQSFFPHTHDHTWTDNGKTNNDDRQTDRHNYGSTDRPTGGFRIDWRAGLTPPELWGPRCVCLARASAFSFYLQPVVCLSGFLIPRQTSDYGTESLASHWVPCIVNSSS